MLKWRARVGKRIGFHGLENNLSRFIVAVLCVCRRNAEKRKFQRDGAAANAEIKSAPAQLIQHADLFESTRDDKRFNSITNGPSRSVLVRCATADKNKLGEAARPCGVP